MSFSFGGNANGFSEHSSPAVENSEVNGQNGASCSSKPSTSKYFSGHNYSQFLPNGRKRLTLPVKRSHSPDENGTLGALYYSNQQTEKLGSSIQFVPAKRPFETDSTELKSKYICLTAKAPAVNGNGHVNGIRAFPTRFTASNLLNGVGNGNGHIAQPPDEPPSTASVTITGIPPPSFDIFPADNVRLQWDTSLRCTTGVGLNNMGNTCFLNSVLQVLTNTAPLANYLLKEGHHEHQLCPASGSSATFCALCVMKNHINRLFTAASNGLDSVSPSLVVNRVRFFMKSHISGRQEDAHEFLRYFIEAMQTAALFPYKDQKLDLFTKETSVISRIFGGYHKNEIVCNSCHSSSVTYDPFLDLSVEIKQSNSLEAALSHYTCTETLSSDNAYLCPKCKKHVSARKIFTICQAPNVLTIQLKRFDHFGKIDRLISYPDRLNLRPYMSEKQGTPVNYKLYGIIVHVGRTTHSGHYYAYVRNPCDQWYLMDDNRVSGVFASHALRNATAYVLFYIRQPTPVASVKPQTKPQTNFIGPQLPPRPVSPVEEKSPAQPEAAQPYFKPTFSETGIRATTAIPLTGILGRVPRMPPQPVVRPITNTWAPFQGHVRPFKLRVLIPNKNGLSPNQCSGRALTPPMTQKCNGQPQAPLLSQRALTTPIIIKLSTKQTTPTQIQDGKGPNPIQDNSISSSTKVVPQLVPYDDDEGSEESG